MVRSKALNRPVGQGPKYRKTAAMKRVKTVRTLRFAIGTAVHKLPQSPNGSEIALTRLGVKRSQVQVLSPRLVDWSL